MKICFFTEMNFVGTVPRNHPNMRTEFAWMCALESDHVGFLNTIEGEWDLGIIIIPKKNIDLLIQSNIIQEIRNKCKKVAVMQEGPNWLWQDWPIEHQVWYLNVIHEMDFLLVHNEWDLNYFKGLTSKNCYELPSLMITDTIENNGWYKHSNDNVIIGGNMCSWYGGIDSYIIALEFNRPIFVPTMGRKIENEEKLERLNHLSYMDWSKWMKELSQYKYGIHLMRTHAAGTFALNCAYWGIPCIGYRGLDTQEKLHELTSISVGNLYQAKVRAQLLRDDKDFYEQCSNTCKLLYDKLYTEEKWKNRFQYIIQKELPTETL